jgi:phosphoribosylformimino-5-aminoimidazole carboxamide ribotide isomerase
MSFVAIPAIDVRDGRVVRLRQGDYGRETSYGDSPEAMALAYADQGSRWLHLVDLDAAKSGAYMLSALLASVSRRLQVQTGGGIRGEHDVERLLAAGAARVVVGTVAVRDPARVAGWIARFGADRLTIALDARQDDDGEWRLPVSGWTESSPRTLTDLVAFYHEAGLTHLLCTDISRDGMLSGFNLDLYRMLGERWPRLRIQASGGVRSLDDIRAARDAGAGAAILGRALLERRFDLPEALAC